MTTISPMPAILHRLLPLTALVWVVWAAIPPGAPKTGPDFDAFGRIPVVSGGRLTIS